MLNRSLLLTVMLIESCDSNLRVSTEAIACTPLSGTSSCEETVSFQSQGVKVDYPNDQLAVAWTKPELFEKVSIALALHEDCTDQTAAFEMASIGMIDVSQVAEGNYYVCLTATNGNSQLAASNNGKVKITLDRTAPVIAPFADVTTNATVVLTPQIQDITTVQRSWKMLSGPAAMSFKDSQAVTTLSFTMDGLYKVRLTATDETGRKSTRDMIITYDTTAPTVYAGADRIVNAPFTQFATAGADALTLAWTKVSGPGNVLFGSPAKASTTVSASADGTYVIRITATDLAGNAAYDEFTLTWDTTSAKVIDVVTGETSSCALFANGRVKCWGSALEGRTGSAIIGGIVPDSGHIAGTMGDSLPYVDLGTGIKAIKIFAGQKHVCAILQDRTLKCWGNNNADPGNNRGGQLGLGDTNHRGDDVGEMGDNLPTVNVGTGRTVLDGSAGEAHTCVLLDNHTVKCWGDNQYGQLGQGHTNDLGDDPNEMGDNLPAINLGTGKKAIAISSGWNSNCAILDDHSVKCWGRADYGILGIADETNNRGDALGDMGDNLAAVSLGTGRSALQVGVGYYHACALLDNRQMKCWGAGGFGQLGSNSNAEVYSNDIATHPTVNVGTGRSVVQISLAEYDTCALLDNSSVKCWGRNQKGQAGQGHTNAIGNDAGEMDTLSALALGTGRFATKIATFVQHVCAVLDNSRLKCWGENASGQLGQESTTNRGDGAGEMGDNLIETTLFGP